MEHTYAQATSKAFAEDRPDAPIEAELQLAETEAKLLDELVGIFHDRLGKIIGPPDPQEGHALNPVQSERSALASRLAEHHARLRTVRESLHSLLARVEL